MPRPFRTLTRASAAVPRAAINALHGSTGAIRYPDERHPIRSHHVGLAHPAEGDDDVDDGAEQDAGAGTDGDLAHLGALMDSLPNMYTEIGAVLAELGRQPRFARQFLTKYQDRVLFGTDGSDLSQHPLYFRVLETEDEYFDYYRKRHAFWKMYGLGLPDDVLKKIYYKNALRIIPGLDASAFPP